MEAKLNHFDEAGNAVMVDVTGKEPTFRAAVPSSVPLHTSKAYAKY